MKNKSERIQTVRIQIDEKMAAIVAIVFIVFLVFLIGYASYLRWIL